MDEPEIKEWALIEMDKNEQDIYECCNENGYNISDILKEPEDDEW